MKPMIRLRAICMVLSLVAIAVIGEAAAPELQIAWLRGVPNDPSSTGIQVAIIPSSQPQAMTFSQTGNPENKQLIRGFSRAKRPLPSLTLVVQNSPNQHETFTLEQVVAKNLKVVSTDEIRFDLCYAAKRRSKASSWNPGAPADAPAITEEGVNQGYLYFDDEKTATPHPFSVRSYSVSVNEARMTVLVGADDDSEVRSLLKSLDLKVMVLVLPDRITRTYVEYKLYRPEAPIFATSSDGLSVSLSADRFEACADPGESGDGS